MRHVHRIGRHGRESGSHDNAQTIISGQIADALQNMHLVAKIEIGCRLIQHQKSRFLGKRAGDEHHLPFAAADFRICAVEQKSHSESFQHAGGYFLIAAAGDTECADTGSLPIITTSITLNGNGGE